LSQAHQELTKREEAQRAGNGAPGQNGNGSVASKRGQKRKSYDAAAAAQAASAPPVKGITKRTRSSNARKTATPSDDDMDDMDDDMDDDMMGDMPPSKGGRNKKPETEEEKRKNFLERNRQGNLILAPAPRAFPLNVTT
jgi:ATF/CREB family transcription factor